MQLHIQSVKYNVYDIMEETVRELHIPMVYIHEYIYVYLSQLSIYQYRSEFFGGMNYDILTRGMEFNPRGAIEILCFLSQTD